MPQSGLTIIEYKGFGKVGKYQEGTNALEVLRSRPPCWRAWSTKGSVGIRRLDVKYTGMGDIDCGEHLEGGSVHKAN